MYQFYILGVNINVTWEVCIPVCRSGNDVPVQLSGLWVEGGHGRNEVDLELIAFIVLGEPTNVFAVAGHVPVNVNLHVHVTVKFVSDR